MLTINITEKFNGVRTIVADLPDHILALIDNPKGIAFGIAINSRRRSPSDCRERRYLVPGALVDIVRLTKVLKRPIPKYAVCNVIAEADKLVDPANNTAKPGEALAMLDQLPDPCKTCPLLDRHNFNDYMCPAVARLSVAVARSVDGVPSITTEFSKN